MSTRVNSRQMRRCLKYVKDRGQLFLLLIAIAVVPAVAGGLILWQMFSEQLDASYEKRLLTAVETFQLILDNKVKELSNALSRMASDNTLQVTMNLEILPQMQRYLADAL